MIDPRVGPTKKALEARAALRKEQDEKQQAEAKALRNAFEEVAETLSGQIVFRWLVQECGVKAPTLSYDGRRGEISPLNTIYNVSKRDVWLAVRKFLTYKQINTIESEREEPTNERAGGDNQ